MPLVISSLDGGIKETIKELENIFGTNDLCKPVVAKIQRTILMDSETIIQKYVRVTSTKIDDKNKVVKGANKILGGPSIRLYCLNLT